MLGNGWSVWPQDRDGKRMPSRIEDAVVAWKPFQERPPSEAEMKRFVRHAPRANVACALGTASGNTFCVDVDCMDEAVSRRIQAIAAEVLGQTPFIRIGRAPKVALIYRYDGGGSPASRMVKLEGRDECAVEILGAGKALTLHGIHYITGRFFHWPELSPLTSCPDEAPAVPAALVDTFMSTVAAEYPFALSARGQVGTQLHTASVPGRTGVLTDGREGHLRDLAWNVVRSNSASLKSAHADGDISNVTARIVAQVVQEFSDGCEVSGRWLNSLQAEATVKVRSAVEKLLTGEMHSAAAVAPQTTNVPVGALWQDYLNLEAILSEPPPPLDFVLPGILAGTMAVLVSPGGAGKSMLALGLAACVAAGRSMWGLLPHDPEAGPVLLLSAEDPKAILAHRLHALVNVPGANISLGNDELFRRNFRVKAVQGTNFGFGTWSPAGFQPSAAFEVLRREVLELRPRLVVLDTLNRCLAGIPENDNAAQGRIVSELEAMVAPVGAACLVLHHVSKGAAREGQGDEQQAARGAGAITDNARWQSNLVGLSKDEALAHGIADEERRRWIRWVVSKSNYAAPPPERWLFREAGGVLRACDLPATVSPEGRGRIVRRSDD